MPLHWPGPPAHQDYCRDSLLGVTACELASWALLSTPGISSQLAPRKVKISQEPGHDLPSDLGIIGQWWVAWVVPGSLVLQCISKIDPNV